MGTLYCRYYSINYGSAESFGPMCQPTCRSTGEACFISQSRGRRFITAPQRTKDQRSSVLYVPRDGRMCASWHARLDWVASCVYQGIQGDGLYAENALTSSNQTLPVRVSCFDVLLQVQVAPLRLGSPCAIVSDLPAGVQFRQHFRVAFDLGFGLGAAYTECSVLRARRPAA